MLHKIPLTFIILFTISIAALTLNIPDTPTAEAENTEWIAETSTKPSIVALATVMKSFRGSLSSELLSAASFPLGHKESYCWTNFPPSMGDDRGGGLDHIHSITRSPNGKDYGIFALNHGPKTLLEHYVLEDHHKMSNKLFDYNIAGLHGTENTEAH
jgi:hypothetical protein